MRVTLRSAVTGALGLGLLSVPVLRRAYVPLRAPVPYAATFFKPLPPAFTPADRALREAQGWRFQALWAAEEVRPAEVAYDPITGVGREASRHRQAIVSDRSGYLGLARDAARRSAALARTPGEAWGAAALQARLECYAGHHQAELQQARRLVALAPRQPRSWRALRRAARCNGLTALARRADGAIAALVEPEVIRDRAASFLRDEPPGS